MAGLRGRLISGSKAMGMGMGMGTESAGRNLGALVGPEAREAREDREDREDRADLEGPEGLEDLGEGSRRCSPELPPPPFQKRRDYSEKWGKGLHGAARLVSNLVYL